MEKFRIRERFNLSGKVAIITGASKGIGMSMARGLAEFGAQVVLSSRKAEAVELAAEALRNDNLLAVGYACHVGESAARDHLIKTVGDEFGRIDILINNAAVSPYYGPIEDMDMAAYQKTQEINVNAALSLSNLVFPLMKENGGSIIHVSSIEADIPGNGMSAYSISKSSLNMLTKSQAKEWGKYGIRVNAIAPGLVKTKFAKALLANDQIMHFIESFVPAGRAADPDEMAGLAVFLASEASSYCTGSIFTADGGFSISGAL